MHDIEIIIRGDSTIVIEEAKRDFCCDWVEEVASGDFQGGSLHPNDGGGCGIDNSSSVENIRNEGDSRISGIRNDRGEVKMNSKSSHSIHQAAVLTKAPLVLAANRAKTGLNRTLMMFNNDREDSNYEGHNASMLSETAHTNMDNSDIQVDTTNTASLDEEKGGAPSSGYSRRLVEYFVVVSSVPKLIVNRERVQSTNQLENNQRNHSESENENINSTSESDIRTPKLTNPKSSAPLPTTAAAIHNANQPPLPPLSAKSNKITPRVAARVDLRRAHLTENFRPGESVLPSISVSGSDLSVVRSGIDTDAAADRTLSDRVHESISANLEQSATIDDAVHRADSGESVQKCTNKVKGNFLRSVKEQKKKLGLQAHQLETRIRSSSHHLETKLKSISLVRPSSGEMNSKHPQQNDDSDDDSSYSSFSNDEDSPSNIPSSAVFQPSAASPTWPRNNLTPSSPPISLQQQRGGGATENIRMDDSFFMNSSREYNDDIDDCILEPVITAQYPPVDHPDQPLNPMLTHFCHPQGVENIVPLHEYKMPKIHHFVLTDSKGGKLYGTCLTVYEEFPMDRDGKHENVDCDDVSLASTREEDQERNYVECSMNGSPIVKRHRRRHINHTYYAPRVLCLLSTWPYLSAFRTYLTQLYRLATTTKLMTAPLERYILNICEEVPAPPPGSFEVQLSILDTSIRIWAPPADQPIPYVSVYYGVLFECLDIGNVLFAWYTLACERKILLVSSQLSLLTVCAEILCSMLFPMRWSHLYIPVLPRFLTPMLDAPMPYLCGISRDNFPHAVGDISDETVVVDLDRNLITMGSQTPDLPILPERRKMKLEAALEKHAGQVFWKARGLTKADVESVRASGDENAIAEMLGRADAVWDEQLCVMDEAFYLAHSPDSMSILYDRDDTTLDTDRKQSRWDAVQEAFLRFYVAMLKDYQKFLPSTTNDLKSWRASMSGTDDPRFLADDFVASQRLDFQPFLEELVSTQQFDDFITRRIYNAGKAPDLTFFDQSIDAKKNRSKLRLKKLETPFLHSANAHRIMKRIDAIEPNRHDLPANDVGVYIYPTWPESFDESLFGTPRPIPKIITAEFDRRAALSAMLKEKRGMVEESRVSGCFNPSPEATAFVLFFVMFSQVIGRDWDSFKKQHENMLDDGYDFDSSINGADSASSPGPWKPEINPPWMAGESFQNLHSNFRPQEKNETVVEEINDVSLYNSCCIPDCDNFCTEKVINPSTFIGKPWAQSNINVVEPESNIGSGHVDENFENQWTKARSVAKAQVDLAVNTLKMLRIRKLASEAIMYKSLIEACGRCGISHRATQLLEMMRQDGLAVDSEIYYCFIKAFSYGDTDKTISSHRAETLSDISAYAPSASGVSSIEPTRRASEEGPSRRGSCDEDNESIRSKFQKQSSRLLDGINHVVSSSLEENKRAFKLSKVKRMQRLFQRNLTKEKKLIVTNSVRTHLDLSNCILEELYPGLVIDTSSDTCPKCSCVLSQDNIIVGWTPCDTKDFSTTCPSCKYRFVPKFSVACSVESFRGSQGAGTPLFVDYLSPWVLLRQIRNLTTPSASPIVADTANEHPTVSGVEGIIDPKFREGDGINATLWWNIIVTFKRFKIPFTFLLQGNFPDQQLIMPTLDDL